MTNTHRLLALFLAGALTFGGLVGSASSNDNPKRKKIQPKPVIEQTCPDNWYVNRVGDKFIFNYTSDIKDEQNKINELQNYATRYSVTPLQITNRKVDGKCVTGILEGSLIKPIPTPTPTPTPKPVTPIPGMQWNLNPYIALGIGKRVVRDTIIDNAHDYTFGLVDGRIVAYKSDDLKVTGDLEAAIGTDDEHDGESILAAKASLMAHRTYPYVWLKGGAKFLQTMDGQQGFLGPEVGMTIGNERVRAYAEGGPLFDITEGNGDVAYGYKGGFTYTVPQFELDINGEKGIVDLYVKDYVNKANVDLTLKGKDNSFGIGASIIANYDSPEALNRTGRETIKNTELEARVNAKVNKWFVKLFGRGKNIGEQGKAYTRSVGSGGFKVGRYFNKF